MATFEEKFVLRERGLVRHLWRDLRVLAHLAKFLWMWFRVARRVRADYRRKDANGETYWLDKVDRGYEGRR